MKKLLAIMLAVLMLFALGACGDDSDKFGEGEKTPVTEEESAVAKYVEENKYTLISSMEESFAKSSGMTCTSSINTIGNGFVISININELDNVDSDTKLQMQSAYDSMSGTFDGMLIDLKKEIPEIEYFAIRVCEKDGDLLAEIRAD